jgi:RNA-binding protein YlmH
MCCSLDFPSLDDVVLPQAKTSADTWSVCYTDFLTPPVCKAVMEVVAPLADIAATPSGGYEQVLHGLNVL